MSQGQIQKSPNRILAFIMILGILAISTVLIFWINSTEPSVEQEDAVKKTAMLIEIEHLKKGDFAPMIQGLGNVQAAQDIILNPRVSGQITKISESFIPGNIVKSGDILLQIDPADYRNNMQQMESALQQAKAALDIESGKYEVAKKEYALINKQLIGKNKALVLREPQMQAAKAAVHSAKASFEQARMELERASVKTPFAAQIITRNVNIGSQINTNTQIARLVGIDEYWVIVAVPVSQLQHLTFPQGNNQGARVIIKSPKAWPENAVREGNVVRLIGALDQTTRLARVLVSVKDPLAIQKRNKQPILVDSIVQTEIEGKLLKNVFRIKRDYLREGNTVWLNRDNKLHISQATVVMKDKEYAYISKGINDNDLLITSSLATVAEGMALRTEIQ
ncbi:efflux RND transporter periplasmic adaptor subunit [Curvivirga sp.]|uniref:efflux RND transporter periplasmic adaptor subunit n=1 Tax=Curvivirga sp. TaxID=2856848 RepID=UPI003B59AF55